MKYLFILLLSGHALAGSNLSQDWITDETSTSTSSEISQSFTAILDAQAKALDKMGTNSLLPFGFQLKELTTDVGVTKTGLLGISAMNTNAGVEIKWKKIAGQNLQEDTFEADLVVPENVSELELNGVADSIVSLVNASGKVRRKDLKGNVLEALQSVHQQINQIDVTSFEAWKLRNLRLDLNFSANGAIWFFARAGVALRVRMEWKLKDLPLTASKMNSPNENTQFITKVLGELNEAAPKVSIKGFEPKKIFVGVGASVRKNFFGLWRYNAGFIGWLGFVPVKVTNKSMNLVNIPLEIKNSDFFMGSEEETLNKSWWPFRRRNISKVSFQTGLVKSLQTAAFFAENAQKPRSAQWRLAEIKTVNEINYTGFFGLSDVTTRGNLEIDFIRKL